MVKGISRRVVGGRGPPPPGVFGEHILVRVRQEGPRARQGGPSPAGGAAILPQALDQRAALPGRARRRRDGRAALGCDVCFRYSLRNLELCVKSFLTSGGGACTNRRLLL